MISCSAMSSCVYYDYGIMEFGLDVYLECNSQDIFDLCVICLQVAHLVGNW